MASDEEIRRMDLNLYLGLPRRLREPDIGSDLALNSLPEMSGSNTHSYQSPPTQDETNPQHESQEYSRYSPSFDPISSFIEEAGLDDEVVGAEENLGIDPIPVPYFPSSPTAQNSTEAMVIEDNGNSTNPHLEYVPYSALGDVVEEVHNHDNNNNHVPYIPLPSNPVSTGVANLSIGGLPEGPAVFRSPFEALQNGSFLPELGSLARELSLSPVHFRGLRRIFDRERERERERPSRRIRRYRSTGPYNRVESDSSELSSATVNALRGRRVSEGLVETNVVAAQKVEGSGEENLEEGQKEQSNGAANFECNVCLDVAKEPVVTSCGHLFCWPCLYQWLHLHCDHKECPVCKGEVTEENVTPIYGRGSAGNEVQKEGEDGSSGLKIPPRPRGLRLESLRQRLTQRPFMPFSRRPRVEDFPSWRLVMEEDHIQTHTQMNQAEANLRLTRIMAAQRHHRRAGSERGGSESSSSATEMSGEGYSLLDRLQRLETRVTPPAIARRGPDFWRRIAFYSLPSSDRLDSIAADLSNAVGRMENGANTSGASASTSVTPQGPAPATLSASVRPQQAPAGTDQASASSTIAVIQGSESSVVPADAHAEPSSVGSSPTLRRRRRNAASSSLDVDGVHHACKRRRLN